MTSQIWLPVEACDAFERALGLVYDPTTDLYLVNDTSRERLLQLNPAFTFKLGNAKFGGDFVNINFPYSAFDQRVSSPIYSSPKNYFPLRRAANATQYTLGRAFLQEAYVTVDYETSEFSVSQAIFKDENPQQIVAISHLEPRNSSSESAELNPSHSISSGAIIGIILGAVTFSIATGLLIFFLLRRGRTSRLPVKNPERIMCEQLDSTSVVQFVPIECDASTPLDRPPRPELEESGAKSGWGLAIELNGETTYELPSG